MALAVVLVLVEDVRVAVGSHPQVLVERADAVLPAFREAQALPERGRLFLVQVRVGVPRRPPGRATGWCAAR
ncbi:hypothetical protein [Streptomyces humi]|uniref:hypothetical protein n=1 Tax=Streptomyces humi TaxID=1428620 RepID=UPI0006287DE6|nr:hypothetical protein [Streptomyces humi]